MIPNAQKLTALIEKSGTLYHSNDIEGAVACCEEALAIDPNCVDALSNLGTIKWALGDTELATELFNKALAINPQHMVAILNMGTLYHDRRDLDGALKFYEMALKVRPRSADVLWRKGIIYLARGDYPNGWALYEEGLGYENIRGKCPEFKIGQWKGNYANRLVIWHEQGLGDTLQFVRYARLCKDIVNKVIVLAPKELHRVLKTCPFIDDVVECVEDGDFDAQVSIMSLPYVLKTTLNTIPAPIPYLFATEAEKWKERLNAESCKGFKVGLVWAGNPRKHQIRFNVIDKKRSLNLEALKPILDAPNVTFFSLQKGEGVDQIAGTNVIDVMGEVKDFADTADIIANLDLVISVDTSVVHLAGAMGKPVWVLSRYDACWRWLENQESSPWYPSARIFGQSEPLNWVDTVQKVADELKKVTS